MQKLAIFLIPFVLVILLAGVAMAQYPGYRPAPTASPTPVQQQPAQPPVAPCPNIGVQSQGSQIVPDGQKAIFIASINGGDPKAVPTIVWNVSAGYIEQGQNTRRIIVDTTGAGTTPEKEVKADVWISGYAPECVLQGSASVKIQPSAVKFGEFGVVPYETVTRNLKALAEFLAQTPDNLYVIVYAGRTNERGFAANWARRLRDGLVALGVNSRRIVALDGGFREQPLFDFYTVASDAIPPRPAPTVDRREIVYPKTTPQTPQTKKP